MTTASRTRAVALAATLTAVVLTSACNDPKPPSATSTSSTTSTFTPSTSSTAPSPTALTPAEKDIKAAEDIVVRYWHVRDTLAKDPHKSLNPVATVARGQAADQSRIILGTYVANGWTQTGNTVVAAMHAIAKGGKAFTVTACVDVSKVNFVDKAGKSVVKPSRPDQQQFTYRVAKTAQGFFVMNDSLKGRAC
jgi:hypothetical protein